MFFAFILVLGAIPGEAQALSDAFGDKLLHLFAYSFLSLVLFGGLSGSVASRAWRTLLMIGLLGAVDETLQGFMSYRNASLEDWLFDLLAAGGTLTVLILLSKRRNQKYQRLPHRVVRPAERPH